MAKLCLLYKLPLHIGRQLPYAISENTLSKSNKRKLTVKLKTKNQEPTKPPATVFHSVLAILDLNICIPPNIRMQRERDITKEMELDTATK